MIASDGISTIFVLKYKHGSMHFEGYKTPEEMIQHYFYQLDDETVDKLICQRIELIKQDNQPMNAKD